MAGKDYYGILGVARDAPEQEIRNAYKSLAKKYHPDVSTHEKAEERFKEVQEAYSVLGDKHKRANYDQWGEAAERFGGFGGAGGFQGFDFSNIFSDLGGFGRGFENMFRAFSGAGRGARASNRGADLRYNLALTLEEAAFGVETEITVERQEGCKPCSGTGAKKGTSLETCQTCKGSGIETKIQRTVFGVFQSSGPCRKCMATGKVIKEPCKECRGKGHVKSKRKIKVKIPAGIDTGSHLRLSGEGNAGRNGGSAGDLYVVVFVEPHKIFKRDKADLFCEVMLGFSATALGSEVTVPTIDGKAKLKVPSGTQTDTIFKMKGLGIKDLRSGRKGDQYVKVVIRTPEKLSKKERQLFDQLAVEEAKRQEKTGFFESIGKRFK